MVPPPRSVLKAVMRALARNAPVGAGIAPAPGKDPRDEKREHAVYQLFRRVRDQVVFMCAPGWRSRAKGAAVRAGGEQHVNSLSAKPRDGQHRKVLESLQHRGNLIQQQAHSAAASSMWAPSR